MAWTDEMVEGLRQMWEEGLTANEIAKRLGVSKNSIVGKVHRLGLSNRNSPIKTSSKTVKKEVEISSVIKPKTVEKKSLKTKETPVKTIKKEETIPVKNESVKVSRVSLNTKKTSAGLSLLE